MQPRNWLLLLSPNYAADVARAVAEFGGRVMNPPGPDGKCGPWSGPECTDVAVCDGNTGKRPTAYAAFLRGKGIPVIYIGVPGYDFGEMARRLGMYGVRDFDGFRKLVMMDHPYLSSQTNHQQRGNDTWLTLTPTRPESTGTGAPSAEQSGNTAKT